MNETYYIKGRQYYKGNCNHCGKYYEGNGKYFCSKKCSMTNQWENGKQKGKLGQVKEKSLNWRGGKAIRNGYIFVYVDSGKYIGEHRIVMQKHLGRKLTNFEQVHHINGIKTDNRIENLQVVVQKMHFGKAKCPKCHFDFLVK